MPRCVHRPLVVAFSHSPRHILFELGCLDRFCSLSLGDCSVVRVGIRPTPISALSYRLNLAALAVFFPRSSCLCCFSRHHASCPRALVTSRCGEIRSTATRRLGLGERSCGPWPDAPRALPRPPLRLRRLSLEAGHPDEGWIHHRRRAFRAWEGMRRALHTEVAGVRRPPPRGIPQRPSDLEGASWWRRWQALFAAMVQRSGRTCAGIVFARPSSPFSLRPETPTSSHASRVRPPASLV